MRHTRYALLALTASLIAACGSSPQNNADAPLAFVPADTPYVYANLEPTPAAVTEQWSRHMQEYMPELANMYDHMLDQAGKDKPENARFIKIARVLLDELRAHDNWDKLRQIGLKPDALVAMYGVGLVPVLRMELGDAAAFKAEVAHIEDKLGEKLTVAKTGAQEYWQVGNEQIAVIAAVEGSHLVVTLLPANAGDPLKQALLGVTKPAQSIAASGALQALAKQYGYSPYGEGYMDFVRLTERLTSAPSGSDADFAKALGLPLTGVTDAVCKSEFVDIAHKFPRAVMGANELAAQRVRVGAQLEIEPALAQEIAAAAGTAPGSGAAGEGVVDVSLALPVLKLKDFWIRQADKVAAKPFACKDLANLNDSFRVSKTKADVTIPPPASDLTGVRFTLDKIDFGAITGGVPDFAAKLLLGTNNPQAALAMAQLALPMLGQLKLAPDGKPVALPPGATPTLHMPPLFAAMSDKALAVAAGTGEDATLGAWLAAPPAREPVFLRMSFGGKFYGMLAQSFDKMGAMLPPEKQAQMADQKKLFALYEQWFKRADMRFIAKPTGIAMEEVVEQN